MPAGYAVTSVTVLGGALLGLGAYVNRACVFGAIARLGSGEWAYVVTPVGFYVGMRDVRLRVFVPGPAETAVRLAGAAGVAVDRALVRRADALAALVVGARRALRATPTESLTVRLRREFATRVWSPRAATTVIGITFFFMLLLVGAWAYTDVLAELARGMAGNLVARTLLLFALFGGAMLGGYTAGRFRSTPVALAQVAKCFAGGVLMGWGSLLIPGGNDGLILVGMPLLWPYAWTAFLTMCVVIGLALVVGKDSHGPRRRARGPLESRSPARSRPRTAKSLQLAADERQPDRRGEPVDRAPRWMRLRPCPPCPPESCRS